MSTKTGQSGNRKRAQKHQNSTVWKADKHKSDPKTKLVQSLTVVNCCEHCTGVIEWKIKYVHKRCLFIIFFVKINTRFAHFRYGKYKPLNQPAKCVKCFNKKIKYAYHCLCEDCVKATGNCAKCNKPVEEIVNLPENSASEAARLDAELQRELKKLPERKRRAFFRYLKKEEKGI